ncbi:TonB-dependent receptor [Alloacidobacterium dinghuense]|uniref:TonB-dependent receptor n=1 Tax=Alloacidobacterium dinghuense TaxID=2763107 RepID=A0A7G8BFM5_9BACT|nr:carboxypeptidase regulatory-like domain-containing protein [Alloacidobacterium dinghuense]QNI31345.1 TonB-dependent receptor [Alloacidobacterium dinghuense]
MARTYRTHPRLIRYLFLVLAVLLGNQGLSAQVASGNIAGVVTDATGAAVVGASVSVTSTATNAERKTVTNGVGEYRFDLLPVGNYQLEVEASGFSHAQVKGLQVLVGTTATVNVPVTTGQVAQTVEVTAGNQLVDTEKTDVSTSVTQRDIQALPLNGRDFANLAILAPGVKQVDSYDPTKNRYAIYAVNGSSGRNTNTTVNGIDNKDNTVGGAVMQLPLEAVQEFNISPNRFSAANGKSEGAALNVVTKSGTNQFHGSLYGFFRTQDFQTNNYFAEKGDQPKPDYSRQQYGGSFGGPIRKDKDFGFFAYEGLRERSSLSVNPDSFNELTIAANSGAFNPAPQPAHTLPTPYDDKRYNGRVDHSFSDTERAFISYTAQDNKSNNDQSTSQNDLSEGNFTINDLILTNFTLNSLLKSNIVNNFTFGFQYWNNLIDSTTRTPYVTFPDGTSFGTNVNVPQKSSQHKFQFRDDFSWVHGTHTFRTGVDFIYEPQVGGFFENNPTPEFDFFDLPSNITDPSKYPQGFATPGLVQAMTGTSGDPSFNLSPKMLGLYFQDDWKISPRFLLNLGIRYDRDIDTYGIDKQKNSRTVQELQAAAATGVPTVPATRNGIAGVGYVPDLSYIGGTYTGLPHNDNLDFSPRIGFAFDVFGNSRVIVRGGYGLYFGQTFENIPLFMLQQANNTVFANTFSIACNGPGDTSCSAANTVPGTDILLSNWRYGVDPMPVIPPASYDLAPGSTGRLMNPAYRNPYTQQINFGLQIAPNPHSVVEVEYVQARGIHENKTVNINPTEYFNGGIRPFSAAFAAAGVPVLGRFGEEESIGRSYYDALNLSYRQQMWKRVTGTANYTYGKALAFEGNPAAFRNTATNPFLGQFRRQDYGPAPNDETHHLTAAATFALPWKISISPIFQVGSPRPVDVYSSSDKWGVGSGRGNAHAIIPKGGKMNDFASLTALFNADGSVYSSSFYKSCLTGGTCEEASYNSTRGQTFVELDARIGKTITIAEKYNIDLFFQGFDLTNRANFGGGTSLQGNVNSLNTNDPSSFLKPLTFITPNSSVLPTSFTGEFGARFSF